MGQFSCDGNGVLVVYENGKRLFDRDVAGSEKPGLSYIIYNRFETWATTGKCKSITVFTKAREAACFVEGAFKDHIGHTG